MQFISKTFTLLILCFYIFSATGQSVENVKAEVTQGNKVIITYDLRGNPEKEQFKVRIYSSHNNYSSPLVRVSGDVSDDFSIRPGTGKQVVWDAAQELGSFSGEMAFEVRTEVYQMLTLTKPAAGKSVRRGSKTSIHWTGGEPSEKIKIDLLKGGTTLSTLGTVNNSGTFNWSIPKTMEKGTDYTLRFSGTSGATTSDPFSIHAKYPMALKIAVPAAVVVGAIVLITKSGSENLPAPPEPSN